jgi:hypothetical protein
MAKSSQKLQKLKAKDYGFKPFQRHPSSKDKRFTKLHESMFESIAWQELKVYSRALYVEMVRKFNGRNDDDISFTYEEGAKLMSKKTFTKAMDQLIDNGFIRLVAHNPHNSKPNIYAFHTAWHNYGTNSFIVVRRAKRKT